MVGPTLAFSDVARDVSARLVAKIPPLLLDRRDDFVRPRVAAKQVQVTQALEALIVAPGPVEEDGLRCTRTTENNTPLLYLVR